MARRKKKKILLVEDEPLLKDLYKKKIQEMGMDVLAVTSAEEANKYLKKEKHIDLIILDILLPRENGVSFLKEIRKKGYQFPVLILTNLENGTLRKKVRRLRIQEYLLKTDYTPSQVIEKIKKYL